MNKYLICATIIGILGINTPANAVTKCVALDYSTDCSFANGSGSDFYATCGNTSVQGVAQCSDNSYEETRSELTITTPLADNQSCYCRMIRPAVSMWIYRMGAEDCFANCAQLCANGLRGNSSFRANLFQTLD